MSDTRRKRRRKMPLLRDSRLPFEPLLLRGCDGKVRYPSKKNAEGAVVALRRLHEAQGTVRKRKSLNAYRCRRCGGWHIGNTTTGGSDNVLLAIRGRERNEHDAAMVVVAWIERRAAAVNRR